MNAVVGREPCGQTDSPLACLRCADCQEQLFMGAKEACANASARQEHRWRKRIELEEALRQAREGSIERPFLVVFFCPVHGRGFEHQCWKCEPRRYVLAAPEYRESEIKAKYPFGAWQRTDGTLFRAVALDVTEGPKTNARGDCWDKYLTLDEVLRGLKWERGR